MDDGWTLGARHMVRGQVRPGASGRPAADEWRIMTQMYDPLPLSRSAFARGCPGRRYRASTSVQSTQHSRLSRLARSTVHRPAMAASAAPVSAGSSTRPADTFTTHVRFLSCPGFRQITLSDLPSEFRGAQLVQVLSMTRKSFEALYTFSTPPATEAIKPCEYESAGSSGKFVRTVSALMKLPDTAMQPRECRCHGFSCCNRLRHARGSRLSLGSLSRSQRG